jgi:hypothetical protein
MVGKKQVGKAMREAAEKADTKRDTRPTKGKTPPQFARDAKLPKAKGKIPPQFVKHSERVK